MIRIGVISDTHLQGYSLELKQLVDTYFHDVDMILHAGDFVAQEVVDVFAPFTVKAVAGNMDPLSIRNQFPLKQVVTVGDFKIGLIHGWGSPVGIEQRIRNEFGTLECLVYGHTHTPVNRVIDGVFFFNPGSATEKRFTKKNTLGILEIGERITGTIIEL